ncbi:hypothetical protein Slala03_56860 [Streptomyces lavendulae subsp. lavendulae]|nr:hypothetical protein Slala03_56860 [Streptomyces lavendulae subsp. lavendulae]
MAEDLVGIRTIGQQPGQGFRVPVLNGQMCRCPVFTHSDIEPSHDGIHQQLSPGDHHLMSRATVGGTWPGMSELLETCRSPDQVGNGSGPAV